MKKSVIISLALLFGLFSAYAQNDQDQKKKNPNAPKMEFEKEVHNFGTIQVGTKAKHEFVFKNTGKEPLIIQNVRASCGCTTPHWPKEPILPGKTAKITAVYNSKGRPGGFHKAITIRSNASTPTKVLYIKGKAVRNKKEETSPEQKKQSIIREGGQAN